MVTNLGLSKCSWNTIDSSPDPWPCWLGLLGTVVHEHLEIPRLVTSALGGQRLIKDHREEKIYVARGTLRRSNSELPEKLRFSANKRTMDVKSNTK